MLGALASALARHELSELNGENGHKLEPPAPPIGGPK